MMLSKQKMLMRGKETNMRWCGQYVLDGKTPRPCYDFDGWGERLEEGHKKGSYKVGNNYRKGYHLSTVFLHLDHSFMGTKPLLFETMLFAPEEKTSDLFGKEFKFHPDLGQWRYSTWEEAEKGHMKQLKMLEADLKRLDREIEKLTGPSTKKHAN